MGFRAQAQSDVASASRRVSLWPLSVSDVSLQSCAAGLLVILQLFVGALCVFVVTRRLSLGHFAGETQGAPDPVAPGGPLPRRPLQ